MKAINKATTPVQAHDLPGITVLLNLQDHPCCVLPRKLRDCESNN